MSQTQETVGFRKAWYTLNEITPTTNTPLEGWTPVGYENINGDLHRMYRNGSEYVTVHPTTGNVSPLVYATTTVTTPKTSPTKENETMAKKTTTVTTIETPKSSKNNTPAPTAAPKATTAKKPTNGKDSAGKAAAEAKGLTIIHFRILKALAYGSPMSYRDIEAKTGYYSILTAQMRQDKEGSLCAQGLCKEQMVEGENGKGKLHFVITVKGQKLLSK